MQLATNREGFQPRTTIDQTKWLGIPPALFGPRMHSFRSSVSLAVRCGQPVFRTVRRQQYAQGCRRLYSNHIEGYSIIGPSPLRFSWQ